MEGRRRVTVYNQMSSLDSSREKLAGLTLDDVLANQNRLFGTPPTQPKSRTLLDIIKEDESNKKDRRSWKAFKDKLRLKRAGSAWTSSIHIPTSDIPIPNHPNSRNNFNQLGRRNSVRFQTHSNSDMSTHYDAHLVEDLDPNDDSDSPSPAPGTGPQFSRRSSTRYGSPNDGGEFPDNSGGGGGSLRPQLSRRNSTTVPSQSEPYRRGRVVTFRDNFEDDDSDEGMHHGTVRTISAREAVAAQEASEAAAAEEAEAEASGPPMMMSLMDLLEETDREMGLEGSRYILSDDEDFDDDEEEEEEEGENGEDREGAMENTCCICMVKHKGSAFTPCGHTFCRMCSRELMVSRGNCPLCNNFILEILEIF